MKHNLLKLSLLVLASTVFINWSAAQRVTIFEADGDNNEFDVSQWSVTGFDVSNDGAISFQQNESATLTLNGTQQYKNIEVEVHFSQTVSLLFDIEVVGTGHTLNRSGAPSSVNTATAGKNIAEVKFLNAQEQNITNIKFSNPTMIATIIYLKITGEPVGGVADIAEESLTSYKAFALNGDLMISTEKELAMELYDGSGRLVVTQHVKAGETIVPVAKNGLYFVHLRDEKTGKSAKVKVVL